IAEDLSTGRGLAADTRGNWKRCAALSLDTSGAVMMLYDHLESSLYESSGGFRSVPGSLPASRPIHRDDSRRGRGRDRRGGPRRSREGDESIDVAAMERRLRC